MLRTAILSITAISLTIAAEPQVPSKTEVEALISKAQNFLLAQAQPNGAFVPGAKYTLGITGLAAEALAKDPLGLPASDPRIAKAVAYVNGFCQPDGGVYEPAAGMGNYGTSIALTLWATTKSGDPAQIKAAQNYLFGLQNTDAKNPCSGGIGYGSKGAGNEDLSNTSFAVQALHASGVPSTDPHMQAALKFLERCQDLSSVNKLPWAKDSGGGVYSPDESKAAGSWDRNPPKPGEPAPKLAPYGSMTYALIATYVTLDVKADDPRVQAALAWTKANYQFEKNPGIVKDNGKEGLFYYFRAMAKTHDLLGTKGFELPDGRNVDWRADLFATLKQRAVIQADKNDQAYWVNEAKRWGEDTPALVTSYVLRSLKSIYGAL